MWPILAYLVNFYTLNKYNFLVFLKSNLTSEKSLVPVLSKFVILTEMAQMTMQYSVCVGGEHIMSTTLQANLCQKLFFLQNMLCTKIVLNVRNNFCTQHVLPRFELGIFMYWTCNSMNNLSSYFGLVDAKIRASDKDLPVNHTIRQN